MSEPILNRRLFQFLRELRDNNNREWFQENKSRYEADVLMPAVELVAALEKPLARIAPMLSVNPKKHGGSIMRIYRDTRFSKDKTPYKTNVGISIRHQANSDIHAPGVYLHLDPDECFLGAGCWRPERSVLKSIREAISEDPRGWKRVRDQKKFRQYFELAGESLKRAPKDFSVDDPMIEDLRRIDFIGLSKMKQSELTSADVVSKLTDRIKATKSWMVFLCDAIDVPY